MLVYERPTLTYLGRFAPDGSWYPAAMSEPKPTPARILLFFPKGQAKPWPAIVVDVVEDKSGAVRCDLQPFAGRGHGPQSLLLGVPFSEKPGVVDTCSYPPRAEPPSPPVDPVGQAQPGLAELNPPKP